MDKKLFGDLAFGTRFIFYGKTYTKIALNMAEDEKHRGHIFMTETKVEPIESDAPKAKTCSDLTGSKPDVNGTLTGVHRHGQKPDQR